MSKRPYCIAVGFEMEGEFMLLHNRQSPIFLEKNENLVLSDSPHLILSCLTLFSLDASGRRLEDHIRIRLGPVFALTSKQGIRLCSKGSWKGAKLWGRGYRFLNMKSRSWLLTRRRWQGSSLMETGWSSVRGQTESVGCCPCPEDRSAPGFPQ